MISLSIDGAVAEILIDRPEVLNALDPASLRGLRDALVSCRDDATVRAVIIGGRGERAFCVGTDLKATAGLSPDYARDYRLDTIGLAKPLIAAVQGYCWGGGLELALQADLRIAAANASFALPEAQVGSFPAGGGAALLMRAIPSAIAMKMLLTGMPIDAEAAHRYGLVSDVVETGRLLDAARELAGRVARCAPLSLEAIRDVAAQSEGKPLDDVFRLTWQAFDAIAATADREEGRRAFAQKRPPRFEGR